MSLAVGFRTTLHRDQRIVPQSPFEHTLFSEYSNGALARAGLRRASPYRRTGCSLPLLLTAPASRRKFLTRLNTRRARSPVQRFDVAFAGGSA